MSRESWLLVLVTALSAYTAGIVWLVQVSGYPLWPRVGLGEFLRFYAVWSSGAWSMIFAPLLVVFVGAVVLLFVRPQGVPVWSLWLGAVMQLALVALTVFWWSPSASNITTPDGSLNVAEYARLMHSHWLRVGMVTIYTVLTCWMLSRHLWPEEQGHLQTSRWILLGTLGFGFYGVGQIWLTQSLCYRIWPQVGQSAFFEYHLAWWHSIWTVIFVPAGITLLGAVTMFWFRPPGVSSRLLWAGLGAQVLLYVLTAIWWGPLMGRLATREQGLLLHNYHLLMTTHWLRVAIVTAYGLLALWALVQAAAPPQAVTKPVQPPTSRNAQPFYRKI